MERFTISKSEKQTIYEIYRACRLCGAGGGYRMPIIQNIIDLDSYEVELRQKIQECLQLEVRPDDRMPPLICELCVDKVNDFHQFLELTRQTNVRTRTRLGLPLQTAKKGEEPSDCILGVTEPVFEKDDESSAKKSTAGPKSKKIKKEPEAVQVKVESPSGPSSRSSSQSSRSSRSTPVAPVAPAAPAAPVAPVAGPRSRRRPEPQQKTVPDTPPTKPASTVTREKKPRVKELQNLLEDTIKYEDSSLLVPRTLKRTKEEPPRPALLPKRAKAAPPKEPAKEPTPTRSKPGPKSKTRPEPKTPETPKPQEKKTPVPTKVYKSKKPQENTAKPPPPVPPAAAPPPPTPPPPPPPPPPQLECAVCGVKLKTTCGFNKHMRTHPPNFTKPQNACNPCGMWFTTSEEAAVHHTYHRSTTFPYHCRHCFNDYTTLNLYDEHIESGVCSVAQKSDFPCAECGKTFPTHTLRDTHKCSKPTVAGKCSHCSTPYTTLKGLKRHETLCNRKRKRDLIADPDVLRRLKPMQVRTGRCDGLLARATGDHYDVSTVKPTYGLAKNYIYPYLKLSAVKPEPLPKNSIVAIPVTQSETDRYSHWDSDDSDSDTVIKRVPSLTVLTIKTLFTKNLLGKLPRKRKRVKNETFDDDFGFISRDINDIISSLGDDMGKSLDGKDLKAKINDIIGCLDYTDDFDTNDETVTVNEISGVGDKNDSTNENLESNESNSREANNVDTSKSVELTDVCQNDNASQINENNDRIDKSENHLNGNDDKKNDLNTEIENYSNDDDRGIDDQTTEIENHSNVNNDSKIIDTLGLINYDNDKGLDLNTENENDSNTNNDKILDNLNTESESQSNSDKEMHNLGSETENVDINNDIKEIDASFQNSVENKMAAENQEPENVTVNGVNHENENEAESNDCNKTAIKESPIKHSIENLIGETDKNPDKYISEVISSIEDIIQKNNQNEMNLKQLNGQNEIDLLNVDENKVNEKRLSDSDKITLDDLLPKEDRPSDLLDNISDEDFNFDA